jgi:transcriptional regulator with XRE-family HTH domain
MPFRHLLLTGEQIRAARALARIEQTILATRSGLSLETIKRLERIRGPVDANVRTLTAIADVFQEMGVVFESGEGNLGVRLVAAAAVARVPEAPRRAAAAEAETIYRLIYFSTATASTMEAMRETLEDIRQTASIHNTEAGVTGVLLARGGRFLQVLEGGREAVRRIYGAISTDPRHGALQMVQFRQVSSRQFGDWSLCCGIFPSDQEMFADEPALADSFRPETISPASILGLLSVMRDLENVEPRRRRGGRDHCLLVAECTDQVCKMGDGRPAAVA